MILEHAVLTVVPGQEEAFEKDFDEARHIIAAADGFRTLRLARGIESPNQFVLLVEWDSLEDHTVGFRESERFVEWRNRLGDYWDPKPQVEHFDFKYAMTRSEKPSVLFVCVHNAGRSQMGAAYVNHLSGGAVEVRSAGSAPADSTNPAVREALLEEGIDIAGERPKLLTPEAVQASDVVITMGCGDACPVFLGKRYLDWKLDDPAGQGVEAVRPIRDDIKARVTELLTQMGVPVVHQ